MAANLDDTLRAWNVNKEAFYAKLEEFKQDYPDAAEALDHARQWFEAEVGSQISPDGIKAIFLQAVAEWQSGKPGYGQSHGGIAG